MTSQACYRPLLQCLAFVLCRELDGLCAARDKYRAMRKQYWPADGGPLPVDTPYDHVIDRLDKALQNTYDNLEKIQSEVYYA